MPGRLFLKDYLLEGGGLDGEGVGEGEGEGHEEGWDEARAVSSR